MVERADPEHHEPNHDGITFGTRLLATDATALAHPENMLQEHWELVGEQLQGITRNVQWWFGDWLNFGEAKYGEKYAAAVTKFGLNLKTAQQYAWMARTFPATRRRELSWSHHPEVAGIADLEERNELLDRAVENKWTKARLRQEIKAPPEDPEKSLADKRFELSELIAQLRTSCTGFSRKVRPDHLDTFAAILQDEAESAREWLVTGPTDEQSTDEDDEDL